MESKLEVGEMVNTFGIKGEIKVYPYVDYLDKIKNIYIKDQKMVISKIRFQKNVAIIKLKGIDDINLIEKYKGSTVYIDESELPKLPEGKYYIKDLIGMDVITDEGKVLGKLDDVFNTGANDIYQVGDILLPATDEVLKKIDIENKQIIVHLIKGLI